tara:strand:+ start:5676 stop:6296 length:621 start_codon:yes stop_codon:yes gene_type:complete
MNTDTQTIITKEIVAGAYSYKEYSELVEKLYAEHRTTNDENGEDMLEYTKLNMQRSNRWDKRGVINDELANKLSDFPRNVTWLVLTEGWCGDASQLLPFLNKMAEISPSIELKLILRDEHLNVMDAYLTNGTSRSIPKLIALDTETLEELGTWGPRPKVIQDRFVEMVADSTMSNDDVKRELHLWYARDKGAGIQAEFFEILDNWN